MPRRWRIFLSLSIFAILADQLSKAYALAKLPGVGIRVPVVDNFFDWVLAYNTGSAFSMFSGTGGARVFLSVIGVLAVVGVIWLVHKTEDRQTTLIAALGLMAGGAVGNLIDRILTGRVTDFILWRYYEKTWPVFNIADVCLCVAAGLFILASFRDKKTTAKAS